MQQVTPILGNESAIQYQGVKDATSGTGIAPIVGLMIGTFKRGRFDKPMTITNENIRSQLGYEPKNPSYIAVQDVLASGVPSVQVLRVKGGGALICQQVNKYYYNAYEIFYDGGLDVPITTQQLRENLNQIVNSLKITINGQVYTQASPAIDAYLGEVNSIRLGINVDIADSTFEICAALPFRVETISM